MPAGREGHRGVGGIEVGKGVQRATASMFANSLCS